MYVHAGDQLLQYLTSLNEVSKTPSLLCATMENEITLASFADTPPTRAAGLFGGVTKLRYR
ncbi:MAG: hypothetical protein A6F71_09790 [Cycloclasticus sp. symbiont of Poecilosclerida sp. M]|nr:MAG: hypothetical protein A6F71_09790 [Cycloclasticus sp. symbiont of Poecilosclerida sp. M]